MSETRRLPDSASRLKAFISYSRSDVHFADELELALRDKGHEPLVDRHGIDAGEDWQERLGALILGCDTVVFVLTDTSAASKICTWEVEEAARLSKRMLVVTLGNVSPGIAPPPQLAGINWIHCWRNPAIPGSSQTKGFLDLDEALRTDLGWLRQQTVLQEQADRWLGRRAMADSPHLLQGDLLTEAQAWARATPKEAVVPEAVARFLAASEQAEANRQAAAESSLAEREQALETARKAAGRVRRATFIGAAVAGLFFLGALAAGGFALSGFAQLEKARSDTMARESARIFESEKGDHTVSLLMALQADPVARRNGLRRVFHGNDGFDAALARLAAAHAHNRLEMVVSPGGGEVTSIAVSPDGTRFATASETGKAKVWDVATGSLVASLTDDKEEWFIWSIAFSPDGTRLVIGAHDGTAEIWDVVKDELVATLAAQEGAFLDVAFSPDGEHLATAHYDSKVKLWDMATGKAVLSLQPDGPYTDITTIHHETGEEVVYSAVYSIAFSRDGARLVTGSTDGTAKIWDTTSGALLTTLVGDGSSVNSVAFSPDGSRVAAGTVDRNLHLWDLETSLAAWTLPGLDGEVRSVAFSPDGTQLATGSSDGTARLWEVATGKDVVLAAQDVAFTSVSFLPDGEGLVTGSSDGTAKIWDLVTGLPAATLLGPEAYIGSVAFSPDGKRLAAASSGSTARLWDVATGETTATLSGHKYTVTSLAFSPDGKQLATGSLDSAAKIWDVATSELVATLKGNAGSLSAVAFSPDGTRLAAGGTHTTELFDLATRRVVASLDGNDGSVASVAFSPDGKRLATASSWNAKLWDIDARTVVTTLDGHGIDVRSVAFSPDGSHLATGSSDGTAKLWNVASGTIVSTLSGHSDTVIEADFSPGGKQLATASFDGKAKIWDWATGTVLATLDTDEEAVGSVAFSPDNSLLATGGGDGTTVLWNVPPILLTNPKEQVRLGCEMLLAAKAPLAFTQQDAQKYPVLQGEPIDPVTGDFVSPCKGVLPDSAFAPKPSPPAEALP